MEELKPATAEMFEQVYSTLLHPHDPEVPKDRWWNIFSQTWNDGGNGHVGYVLEDEGEIVGFLGLLFSERYIAGSVEPFANVTSWIARNGRGRGATLLFPLRDLRSHTITNLTSSPEAYRVFRRFGFEVLDTHYRIIPTVQPRRSRRWSVTEDESEIVGVLGENDLRVYHDHAPYVRQLVAADSSRYCYLVYSTVRRRGIPVAKIHHFGDAGAADAALPDIGRFLFRTHGILALDCDARLVGRMEESWSIRRKLAVPRLYRSGSVAPEEISELYSELVFLGNV